MSRIAQLAIEAAPLINEAIQMGYWLALKQVGMQRDKAIAMYQEQFGEDPMPVLLDDWEEDHG